MTVIAACLGALAGIGVFLAAAGLRGVQGVYSPVRLPDFFARGCRQDLVLRLGLAIGLFVVVLLATSWVIAGVIAGGLGAAGPTLFGGAQRRRVAVARIEAIASWTEMLRDVTASGAGIQETIAVTAPVAPAAIASEVRNLGVALERERLQTALFAFADEVTDPMADLVVAALLTAASEQTRRLGELLGSLATTTREQAALRLRIEAGRARTRSTAKAVVVIALVSAIWFVAFDRGFLGPYGSALGELVLGLIGGCFAAAFWLLAKMGRDRPLPRLLASRGEP